MTSKIVTARKIFGQTGSVAVADLAKRDIYFVNGDEDLVAVHRPNLERLQMLS